MKASQAIFIDRFIGSPLCMLLSFLNFFRKLLFSGREKKGVSDMKSVLFVQLSEMGSVLLAYQSIKKCMEEMPEAEFCFLTFKRNKEIVSLLGLFKEENILSIRDDSLWTLGMDFLRFAFLTRRFDLCFEFELFSRFSAMLCFFSGAGRVVGFHSHYTENIYRGNFLTDRVYYNPYSHISRNFYALVQCFLSGSLNVKIEDSEISCPKYSSDGALKEKLLKKLETACGKVISAKELIVAINPSAGKFLPVRAWPASHYVRLAEMILEKTDAYVCIVGLPEEIKDNKKISSQLTDYDRCFDFTGKTDSIRELLELFSISDILVTSDGGPAHFACMTDIFIIALFGPETPLLYGPLSEKSKTFHSPFHCSPCLSAFNHRSSECKNNICMESIRPEEVFGAILNFIKK